LRSLAHYKEQVDTMQLVADDLPILKDDPSALRVWPFPAHTRSHIQCHTKRYCSLHIRKDPEEIHIRFSLNG
jgi:hypothetical protein